MLLVDNSVYTTSDNTNNFRIVAVFDNAVYCVKLNKKHCMPYYISKDELVRLIESGYYVKGNEPHPIFRPEDMITEKDKVIRDKSFLAVKQLWADKTVALDNHRRAKKIKEISESLGIKPTKLRRDFSRFLQRGMTSNALLPDNYLKGGLGKSKRASQVKRGRPIKPGKSRKLGVNITPDVVQKIDKIVAKHWANPKKYTLTECYNELIRSFYVVRSYINGQEVTAVMDSDKIPTYHQFYYHVKKCLEVDKGKRLQKRIGASRFDRTSRALLGDITGECVGPGYRYQIDATHSRVYVVSSMDQEACIGEAIIYIIIDVFSRLITGLYVGIEEPSWLGAAMAIDNIVEDKVSYCKQFGIDISEEQWPNCHLPEAILADRGEFKGDYPEGLTNILGIDIENTAPYRADLKPIVERHFRTLKERLRNVPGAMKRQGRERGDKDTRKDACLTTKELTRIVLYHIVHHNSSVMKNYDVNQVNIHDTTVIPSPVELWQWGLLNLRCGFKAVDRDILRLALMPKDTAIITRGGILFKRLFYNCKRAVEEEWFVSPDEHTRIPIAYDLRSTNQIYLLDSNQYNFTVCDLMPKCSAYRDMCFEDYLEITRIKDGIKDAANHKKLQGRLDLEDETRQIVNGAKQRRTGQVDVSAIKQHRKDERTYRRREEAFVLGTSQPRELPARKFTENLSNREKYIAYANKREEIHEHE